MSDPAQIMEPLRRALSDARPGLETTCVAAYVQEVALTIAADEGGLKAKAAKVAAATDERWVSTGDRQHSGAWGAATSPAEHTSGWAGALAG